MNLLSLFRRGHSTLQIALITKREEAEVYNLLSQQREEERVRLLRAASSRRRYREHREAILDSFKKERGT